MTKTFITLLLFVTLLAACNAETPVPVPPTATSIAQEAQPSAYPEPASTAIQVVETAYPEPSAEAVRSSGRPSAPSAETTAYPEPSTSTAIPSDAQALVRSMADQVVLAFKERKLIAMAVMVHPDGLRFSPYAFVTPEDKVFRVVELPDLLEDPQIYQWGAFAGSGEPIEMTFAEYYDEFVYDVDFATAPQVSINERMGTGTIDNTAEFYPGSIVVEYHFPGFDEQYQGMDWRSLRLVFVDYMGRWVLAGVIHDEWTP